MFHLRKLLVIAVLALTCLGGLVGCQPAADPGAAPGTTEPGGY